MPSVISALLIFKSTWMKTELKQFEIWSANLNHGKGSEPGKIRPVVIVQSNMLNKFDHGSFIICPISSQNRPGLRLLRLPITPDADNGLEKESYLLADQILAIDVSRILEKIGKLEKQIAQDLMESIKVIIGA